MSLNISDWATDTPGHAIKISIPPKTGLTELSNDNTTGTIAMV